MKVTTGLAKSNGSLPPSGWLKVTCGLTACTPGSVPGQTLGNESGKTLFFILCLLTNLLIAINLVRGVVCASVFVMPVYLAKTAEPIEMPFWGAHMR